MARGAIVAVTLALGCGPGPQRPVAVGPVQPVLVEAPPVTAAAVVERRVEPAGPVTLLAEVLSVGVEPGGWRPLVVSGDGATLGGFWSATELAFVDAARGLRVVPIAEAEAVLTREEFRRLAADEALPVYEVAEVDGKVRARWSDRVGAVAQAVPRRMCCTWTARPGFILAGRSEVFAEASMVCARPDLEFCAAYEGRTARTIVTVPLAAEASAKPRYRGLPDSVVDRMPDALGPTQQLANMLSIGPFGPTPDGVLVLRVDDVGALTGFLQTVIAGRSRRVPVPGLPWVMHEVNEVVYADVDGDAADEAIVLVNALTGIGPTGAEEFSAAHVLKWDGTQLVSVFAAEQRFVGATTGAQVRARLQQRRGR